MEGTGQERGWIRRITLAAMFLALGMVLPFFTGQIPQFGKMLLPMHLPVLLCGLICGWKYAGAVGAIVPVLRWSVFNIPAMPGAVAMAFELAAYGIIAGALYCGRRRQGIGAVYRALLAAMVGGRAVWAAARMVMLGVVQVPFTWEIFLTDALLGAIPGIILQLTFIPALMAVLDRTGLVPFR